MQDIPLHARALAKIITHGELPGIVCDNLKHDNEIIRGHYCSNYFKSPNKKSSWNAILWSIAPPMPTFKKKIRNGATGNGSTRTTDAKSKQTKPILIDSFARPTFTEETTKKGNKQSSKLQQTAMLKYASQKKQWYNVLRNEHRKRKGVCSASSREKKMHRYKWAL